jgi:hypothetical protein
MRHARIFSQADATGLDPGPHCSVDGGGKSTDNRISNALSSQQIDDVEK